MDSVYPSKADAWLVSVLGLAAAASIYAAAEIAPPSSASEWATLLSCIVLGVALPTWLLVGTRYTLSKDSLLIVSGPFRWRVPLQSITDVTPTHNPLSSPALSLDRLRIEYASGKKAVMISPRDKQGFIRDLESRRRGAR
jgi:membrane protein YdbS with pleckstrin-like domain